MATSKKCKTSLGILKDMLTDHRTYAPFCHGTKMKNVKTILNDGELRPRKCSSSGVCRPSNYEYDLKYQSQEDLVYLGKSDETMCWASAYDNYDDWKKTWRMRGEDEPGIIFYIDELPNQENLVADEDHFSRGYWDTLNYGIRQAKERLKLPKTHKDAPQEFKDKWLDYALEKSRDYLPQTTNTPSWPEKSVEQVIKVLMDCPVKEIEKMVLELPEWAQSLLDISTVAYKGSVPIDESKAIRRGCRHREVLGNLAETLGLFVRC